MYKPDEAMSVVEVLRGEPIIWPKGDRAHHFDIMEHVKKMGGKIIYEDAQVVAYEEPADDDREGPMEKGELRITVAPKARVATLLDLDVGDAGLAAHLLVAIQQVAFKLGLHKTGFEIRSNILPPYQERPRLRLKIRPPAAKGKGEDLG